MTEKQIDKREQELREKKLNGGLSENDKREMKELRFRGWVNSCLIYSCNYKLEPESLKELDRCFGGTTLSLYDIELDRALEIIEEQKESFKKAKVIHGVYTDSEGCTYNSCDWGD